MAAAIKRLSDGLYILFLGEQVEANEITENIERYQRAAQHGPTPTLIIDSIAVKNPLQAARQVAKQLQTSTPRVIVVNGSYAGGILHQRLHQLLTAPSVEVVGCSEQNVAIAYAKSAMGLTDTDDAPVCDYL